jgi:hypothetical protein
MCPPLRADEASGEMQLIPALYDEAGNVCRYWLSFWGIEDRKR